MCPTVKVAPGLARAAEAQAGRRTRCRSPLRFCILRTSSAPRSRVRGVAVSCVTNSVVVLRLALVSLRSFVKRKRGTSAGAFRFALWRCVDAEVFFEVMELDGSVIHDVVEVDLPDTHRALEMASRTLMDTLSEKGLRHPAYHVMVVVKDEAAREIGRRDGSVSRSDRRSRR